MNRTSPDHGQHVAVVLVDYRNPSDTVACVESLLGLSYPDVAVIVVDNASPERDDLALRERFGDRIAVIRSRENGGFAAGANQGIRAALELGVGAIWLLNNDTLVPADVLGRLVDALDGSPDFGLLSPVITGSETTGWSDEVWFAGGRVDLRRGTASHSTDLPALSTGRVLDTGFVSGCAMLIRREVFEAIGLLEESYFLFWEDVEFCVRARAAGWKCGVVPDARVAHRVHGTIGGRNYEALAIRNSRDVSGRHGSARDVAGIALRSWLGITQAVAGVALGADRDGARRRLRGHALGLGRLTRAVARRTARRPAPFPEWRPPVSATQE